MTITRGPGAGRRAATVTAVEIRPFEERDWPQVWAIVREVVQAADTYTYEPTMTEAEARAVWLAEAPSLTVVAVEGDRVLGTAKTGPNRPGPGSHVSTASFMVDAATRGRGVATALCRFVLAWAREQGFTAMQFNAVASTNTGAVRIYERLGFRIVGTVPGAFRHPTEGFVDLHVMHCDLRAPATTS